jgi:hypothetical protein
MDRSIKAYDLNHQTSIEYQKLIAFLGTKFPMSEAIQKYLETQVG